MARKALLLAVSILAYLSILYVAPSPTNIILAPIVAGLLASRIGGRAVHSLGLGIAIGVASYLAAVIVAGALPILITVSIELAGPMGLLLPPVYHGLATGLVTVIASEVWSR